MGKFTDKARDVVKGSPIMSGRVAIKTEDLIRKYPKGFTLIEFDIIDYIDAVTGETKSYPVFAIAEDSTVYYAGGKSLTDIAMSWCDGCTVEEASAELKAEGGVRVKLESVRTKQGRTFTQVEVL